MIFACICYTVSRIKVRKTMDAPPIESSDSRDSRLSRRGFDPESDNYQGFRGPGFDAPMFEGSYNPSYQSGSYDPTDSDSWTSLYELQELWTDDGIDGC